MGLVSSLVETERDESVRSKDDGWVISYHILIARQDCWLVGRLVG